MWRQRNMLWAKKCGKNSKDNERKNGHAPWKWLECCGKGDETFQKGNAEKTRTISERPRKMNK